MSPSTRRFAVRRVGLPLGVVASGTLALALAGGPAYAGGLPTLPLPTPTLNLVPGAPCTLQELIPQDLGLKCVNGILQKIVPAPVQSAVGGAASSAAGALQQGAQQLGQSLQQGAQQLGASAPSVPGAPGSSTPGSTSATPGQPAAPGSPTPATDPNANLLSAASYAPVGLGDFTSFAPSSLGGSSSLESVPSPMLADLPTAQLAAVQAPLIAAGESASRESSVVSRLGGAALPGILVVLATAAVATVGAGNIRVWQGRIAAKRASSATS